MERVVNRDVYIDSLTKLNNSLMRETMNCKKTMGFTLIELLIVVAIIAILAGIALVNFMAAQTRAKVSRAKAEIKTVVLALESYYVDYNAYPPYHYLSLTEFYLGGWANVVGQPEPYDGLNPITSPIAYITSMPNDPFYNKGNNDPFEKKNYSYVNWDRAFDIAPIQTFTTAKEGFGPYRVHSLGTDRFGPDPSH